MQFVARRFFSTSLKDILKAEVIPSVRDSTLLTIQNL